MLGEVLQATPKTTRIIQNIWSSITNLLPVIVVAIVGYIFVFKYFLPKYNSMVQLDEDVSEAESNINVLLQRRQDELSRLSVAVREATGHETTTLNEITEARDALDAAESSQEQAAASEQVRQAVTALDAREEDYPELTATANIQNLQENISEIEEELAEQREEYNEIVAKYNKATRQFPGSVLARIGGFEPKEPFQPSSDTLVGEGIGIESPVGTSQIEQDTMDAQTIDSSVTEEEREEVTEPD